MQPSSTAAPAPIPSPPVPDEVSPQQSRWNRYIWVWAGVWLFYLAQPVVQAWQQPEPWRRWLAIAALTVFGTVFLWSFVVARASLRLGRTLQLARAWALIALCSTLVAGTTLLLGQNGLALFVYVGVMAVFLLPGQVGPLALLGLIVGTVTLQHTVPGWHADFGVPFSIFIGGMAMWGVVRLVQRNGELAAAREEITRLAVADERNRFGRDLHDILGHSLTVVAIKAELAGRLVRLDPDRAETEITEVEHLARQALADVRSAVAGYREVTLAAELVNARSALTAAGIDADLPGAIDDVPAGRRELFGWVVREGITNVVRHSGASRCRVRVGPADVEITDDGRGSRTPVGAALTPAALAATTGGHGLVGLRERVEAAGGSLSVAIAPEGGFALKVRA